jgi:cardiolipin synthase
VIHPPTAVWLGLYALSLFAILRALTRGHAVPGTLAWILAILMFPGLGAAAYLLVANPSIRRTSRRKRLKAEALRLAIAARVDEGPSAEAASALSPIERSILHLATRLTGLLPSGGNAVELLTENGAAFGRIEQALAAARRSIWAEYYIIQGDETGRRFLEILADRAAAGVDVRLLYDAVGSSRADPARLAAIVAAGGRAEAFLPLNPLRRRWAIHLRNHRKVVVVDGAEGFTGGMNVGNEYSGRARKRRTEPWRDTHLALRGPAVRDLAQTFAEDWHFATDERLLPPPRPKPPPPPPGAAIVAVVPSGPDQEQNANALAYFAGIASARARCYVTSPYFVPDEPTKRALESAALRGVDVRLLVPGRSDVALLRAAARSYYAPLVRAGVRVFEYRPAMLHAKTMAVDGAWGMVGSANLDIRSFRWNFEVGAIAFDPEFARRLEERFLADLAESQEITPQWLGRRRFPTRLRESAARLLSPLL